MTQRLGNGIIHRIGGVAEKITALVIELFDESVQPRFLFRQAGEKAPPHHVGRCLGAAEDTMIYTAGVFPLRHHIANIIQRPTFLIAGKGDGEFFIYITLKYAAQKALKSAVVLKCHISPSHTYLPNCIEQ